MFALNNKEGSNSKIASQMDTLIGPAASLKGDISTEGNLRIDGKFQGDITCGGEVIIGEEGKVKGSIQCNLLVIHGKVEGNIKCAGLVELMATAELKGDIEVKAVAIREGAVFEGKSIMKTTSTLSEKNVLKTKSEFKESKEYSK